MKTLIEKDSHTTTTEYTSPKITFDPILNEYSYSNTTIGYDIKIPKDWVVEEQMYTFDSHSQPIPITYIETSKKEKRIAIIPEFQDDDLYNVISQLQREYSHGSEQIVYLSPGGFLCSSELQESTDCPFFIMPIYTHARWYEIHVPNDAKEIISLYKKLTSHLNTSSPETVKKTLLPDFVITHAAYIESEDPNIFVIELQVENKNRYPYKSAVSISISEINTHTFLTSEFIHPKNQNEYTTKRKQRIIFDKSKLVNPYNLTPTISITVNGISSVLVDESNPDNNTFLLHGR